LSYEELLAQGQNIKENYKDLPTSGVNLWRMARKDGARIYVLGTEHGATLRQVGIDIGVRRSLVRWLRTTDFTHIFSETAMTIPKVPAVDDLVGTLEEVIAMEAGFKALHHQKPAGMAGKEWNPIPAEGHSRHKKTLEKPG
jgi:hypothetical protein